MKEEYNRQHEDNKIQIDLVDEDDDECEGADWQLHSEYCPRKVSIVNVKGQTGNYILNIALER